MRRINIQMQKKRYSCFAILLFATILLYSCEYKVDINNSESVVGKSDYPEKGAMILLADRPVQLETPLKVFREDITPNESFFVRWHLSQLLSKIDIDTFKLRIGGEVDKPLEISMNDLKTKFPHDSVIALAICAGNSRATFSPKVPGVQWCNGAMGNAKWKGVRLKDILQKAGVKKGAVDVTFQGLDRPPMPGIPAFIKSLNIQHAMDGDVLVAYEMNGKPLPMLNGYPLKLVVPGWYATYWVGSLANINVLPDSFSGYWMKTAYRIPESGPNESPDKLAKATVPLTKILLHSIFVEPDTAELLGVDKQCLVEGLAFNDGSGIAKVELSFNDGKTWVETKLNQESGKYSWRRWQYYWTPNAKGIYQLCVRATDKKGQTQTEKQWNRSGYARGFMEHIKVRVN